MLDNADSRPDEQYPLLKVDGGGDMSNVQPPPTVVAPGWTVTCSKKPRFSRWPEFVSACWMTLILCGISFLVFHALGMGLYRRQQLIIMKCNTSNHASNVYFHHIVQRGSQIPFVIYSEYLADMATTYPLLQFNVFFLIDDYYPELLRSGKRHMYHSWIYNHKLVDITEAAYTDFQKRYQNINVTIMPLSKYMAMTPLKFKWRWIPQAHLPFYARVFAVWHNGGIGIDLRTFNNDYHTHLPSDPRISIILKQHNDGINTSEYSKALSKVDNDEANAFFTLFSGLINNFLNETRYFINTTLLFPSTIEQQNPLIKTNRSKREISLEFDNKTEPINNPNNFYNIDVPKNNTEIVADNGAKISNNATTDSGKKEFNVTDVKFAKNGSGHHQVVLFYDFSILSDVSGPSLPFHSVHKKSNTVSRLLSLDAEGMFIAASSRLHPFLAHLISAGCFGVHPKSAIQDALLTQCSGIFKDDVYCNNIYIL